MSSAVPRFLGVRFEYLSPEEEQLLDTSLHSELTRLQSYIIALCGVLSRSDELYSVGAGLLRAPRISIWVDLDGLKERFRSKTHARPYRSFDLQISMEDSDSYSLLLYEDATEPRVDAPRLYELVAECNVDKASLGITCSDSQSHCCDATL